MPRKRKGADLSRSTSKARNLRNSRSERTEEQIQQQNTDARVRMAQLHQEEPEDTRAERNEVRRLEQRQSRRFTVSRRRTNDQQRQQKPIRNIHKTKNNVPNTPVPSKQGKHTKRATAEKDKTA
ncbi:unnamed protein product [Parnassius apollo]|uniref:(apollo) hypothetical protein n=1 Tax=Parnassius apollo TaxID=110799 RepID=A0A8S3XV24_PARAO|nr:unnamed protein product [Parnassius apollo]